jgi:2,3-dihydroxybenzoate decarboxylase/5-carboxyvanillate decarboxylase
MAIDRRTMLGAAAAIAAAGAAGVEAAQPDSRPPARNFRRIATEEAWAIPEQREAIAAIARSTWDNLDVRNLRGGSAPTSATGATAVEGAGSALGRRLLDVEDERLEQMDRDGVAMQILSLTSPGVQLFDAATAVSMAQLANDRLAEVVARHPARYAGLATFAPQDPARAAREMERAVRDLKLNGFIVNSHTNNEYLDEQKFWPILEAAEALDSAIYLHPRSPADTMARPFSDYNMHAAIWGFQAETGTHAMRLILSGVFDRFPRLRIVLGHMGESIPYNLWRADHWYNYRRSIQRSSLTPTEVFKRNFLITTSGVEHQPVLDYCLQVVGVDNIMWAIDYPYQESAPAVRFMNEASISDADKAKIYHLNAERIFRLPTG